MNTLATIILVGFILLVLFGLTVVGSTIKISSQASRIEEAERRKLDVKESRNNA